MIYFCDFFFYKKGKLSKSWPCLVIIWHQLLVFISKTNEINRLFFSFNFFFFHFTFPVFLCYICGSFFFKLKWVLLLFLPVLIWDLFEMMKIWICINSCVKIEGFKFKMFLCRNFMSELLKATTTNKNYLKDIIVFKGNLQL